MTVDRAGRGLASGGGLAAAALCVLSLALGGAAARAWLGAAALCAAVPIGAVGLAMMIRLIPGPWRAGLAAPLEGLNGVIPAAALAVAPLLILPGRLYPWARHGVGHGFHDAYLSPPFVAVRAVVWFALLALLALRQRSGKGGGSTAMVGLMVYVPFSSLIAIDWLMSLDPVFSSSGFGLYALALEMNLALALAVIAAVGRGLDERGRDVVGAVLFSSTAMWAYLGFMQYIVYWTGDLPNGVNWFHRRGGWSAAAWIAIAMRFGPGAALIVGSLRRNPRALSILAAITALGAVPEMAWLMLPAAEPQPHLIDLALFLAATTALAVAGLGLYRLFVPPREAGA